MNYQNLEKFLSKPRLQRYLDVCNNDEERALNLYKANVKLSQAFIPIFHYFEVSLRNQIHEVLSTDYANPNWIIDETKIGGKLGSTFFSREVEVIINRLNEDNKPITSDRVIAGTSMAFWVEMFADEYDSKFGQLPLHAFPKKIQNLTKKSAYRFLYSIKDFRNRIAHHEPVLIVTNNLINPPRPKIHTNTAVKVRDNIISLSEQIHPSLKTLLEEHNIINEIIRDINLI